MVDHTTDNGAGRGFNPGMQKMNFESPDCKHIQHINISKRIAMLDGVVASRVTFAAGATTAEVSESGVVGELERCPLPHVAYVISGSLAVRQLDGSEEQFDAGDVMLLPPEHDAWAVGDEDCVFVEFSRGADDYYGKYTGDHAPY